MGERRGTDQGGGRNGSKYRGRREKQPKQIGGREKNDLTD